MRYARLGGLWAILALCALWQGCDSGGGGTGGGGKTIGGGNTPSYLLYTDATAGTVNVVSIPTSGVITAAGSPTPTGVQPISVITTPDGKFAYVLNANSTNVTQFSVAASGGLTEIQGAVGTGLQPSGIAVDPQGRFVAVINKGSGAGASVSIFTVNTNGGLVAVGAPVPLNVTNPQAVTISGNFIYIAAANAIDVLLFTPGTSTFSFLGGSSISAGPSSTNIAALYSPPQASNLLYAADLSTNTLLSYAINNGALQATGSLVTGTQPVAMVADAQNHFVFVANRDSNNLAVFAVNVTTGQLTPAATPLVATGTSPNVLAYDPVNNFLFVGLSGTKQIAAFAVNTSTGGLTSMGSPFTVTNAASGMAVAKP